MTIFAIIIYSLFAFMCLWFIITGVKKIKQIRSSQSLAEFYTDEEEHDKAIKESEQYEKGYFERIKQGEQSQQFLAVGSFAVSSFLRSLLAAEGIPSYTQNEHINSMYSLNALGGASSFSIKLYILIADYDRAYDIIYDFISSHSAEQKATDQKKEVSNKGLALGTFFLAGLPIDGIEDAVHGITIFPRIDG